MKSIFFVAMLGIAIIGCNSSSNKALPAATQVEIEEVKKDSFFPVTSFIKGQLLLLDSLQVTPLHTITINNKVDSIWIKKAGLPSLLSSFILPVIKETNLTNYFKETSFKDQTLNAITFTYDPIKALPDSIPLRHWDVYIDPETGKVTKVYMVKQFKEKEKIITQQLTWKTDKWAMIVTLTNKLDGSTLVLKKDKFIWDFNQ